MWAFKRNILKLPKKEEIIVLPDFDYAIFTYEFFDGRDLDTRTGILSPIELQTPDNLTLGYGRQSCVPTSAASTWSWVVIPEGAYLDFSGDNTGLGFESCLLDLKKIRTLFPATTEIKIALRCAWYGDIGVQPVEIKAKFYKGGTIQKVNYTAIPANNFKYVCTGFTEEIIYTTPSKVITQKYHDTNLPTIGEYGLVGIANFTYNFISGEGSFQQT